MNHARFEELLAVYRDLEDAERDQVERHIQECPQCAAELQAYEVMDRDLAALEDPSPHDRLRRRFHAAVARQRPQARIDWGWLSRRGGRLVEVGMVVLLLLGVWFVLYDRVRPASPAQPGEGGAVSVSTVAVPTPAATPTLSTPGPGVAAILANPPAPGEVVELDAYYAGAQRYPFRGGPRLANDQVACPERWGAALTDRSFPSALRVLNMTHGNVLPEDEAWLVAVTPEQAQPGVRTMPQLPYHARLRGRLGNPAFAHCPEAARIFVVEEVVSVYQQEPPATYPARPPEDYAAWPRYHDARAGFSLPHPPDWQVQWLDDVTWSLHDPQWPGYPVRVRIHSGETFYDPYEPASLPALLEGSSMGVYEQGWSLEGMAGSQRLAGYMVDRDGPPGERTIAALFSAHGRTYELSLRYPLGFDAQQGLLSAYTAMVEGFRLDAPPGPTPTPPVRQTLGEGPFLTPEEALARVREREGQAVELLDARLVPEAEARRQADACSTFVGHADGVWLLTVRGHFEGMERTMRLFVDATDGAPLCGEEIAPAQEGEFAIYLAQGIAAADLAGADLQTIRLEDEPVLSTGDIVAYAWETHEITLTAAAAERLGQLRTPVSGTPFVACVGREPIYAGAFWPSFSSLSYSGIVIDPILPAAGLGYVRIEMGYPGPGFFAGEDPRSDPRVRRALERAGKLQPLGPAATATPVGG